MTDTMDQLNTAIDRVLSYQPQNLMASRKEKLIEGDYMKEILVKLVNKSKWWHVPPVDPEAYAKRGKFLASTYSQAEFYGRPNNEPENVNIKNPVFGFSELEILEQLFEGADLTGALKIYGAIVNSDGEIYQKRIALDAKMHAKAKQLRFDAIVLMTEAGRVALRKSRKPSSIELNLIQQRGNSIKPSQKIHSDEC